MGADPFGKARRGFALQRQSGQSDESISTRYWGGNINRCSWCDSTSRSRRHDVAAHRSMIVRLVLERLDVVVGPLLDAELPARSGMPQLPPFSPRPCGAGDASLRLPAPLNLKAVQPQEEFLSRGSRCSSRPPRPWAVRGLWIGGISPRGERHNASRPGHRSGVAG